MSIQSQIDRINTAKSEIASAISAKGVAVAEGTRIEGLPALIRSIPQEGGSGGGSGIIDVTELPTENIDENAVYRVTESYKKNPTDMWLVYDTGDAESITMLLVAGYGVTPNIYLVDELPTEMKSSDLDMFSEFHIYIVRSSGIGYLHTQGMTLTLGMAFWGEEGYDRGITDDPYSETEYGVYVTLEKYGEVIKYFVRDNGEWKEITAQFVEVSLIGGKNVESLTGAYTGEPLEVTDSRSEIDIVDTMIKDKVIPSKIIVKTPLISDCVSKEIYQVPKKWFLTESGDYIDYVRAGLFMGCTSLRDIELPENTIKIEDYAFFNCSSLGLTSLPDYVGLIGQQAFWNCHGLRLTNLPENVERVEYSCFSHCINLELTSLPQNLYKIDSQAFYECMKLKLTSLPEGLKVIGNSAFFRCYDLALTSLPQSLEEIGNTAFAACTGLTTITFKSKPNSVGFSMFEQCDNLTTINVPWAQGEMPYAPWGAVNATINYNYTGE